MADVHFGYVIDLASGEEWWAARGQGARLDGSLLPPPDPDRRDVEILGVEMAYPRRVAAAGPVLERSGARRVRCIGSLALATCWVAADRYDAMLSLGPSRSVDVAAAQLVVREAGREGPPLRPRPRPGGGSPSTWGEYPLAPRRSRGPEPWIDLMSALLWAPPGTSSPPWSSTRRAVPTRPSPASGGGGAAGASPTSTPTGRRIDDPEVLDRIRALAIPPAWTDVWICPDPAGHIQAIGTDARGRTPVPLPRRLAGAAGPGEVRPHARVRRRAARPPRRCGRSTWPATA